MQTNKGKPKEINNRSTQTQTKYGGENSNENPSDWKQTRPRQTHKKILWDFFLKVLHAIFFKLLKIETEITLPTFFYKASITIIHKTGKYTTRKKITGQYS